MATARKNARKEELSWTMVQIAQFIADKLYADEMSARQHLEKAIGELAEAHRLLVWDRP